MNTTTSDATQRITCDVPTMLNDYGRHPKLLANITSDGLWVNCRTCKKAHFIAREVCIEAWTHGESVVKGCEG